MRAHLSNLPVPLRRFSISTQPETPRSIDALSAAACNMEGIGDCDGDHDDARASDDLLAKMKDPVTTAAVACSTTSALSSEPPSKRFKARAEEDEGAGEDESSSGSSGSSGAGSAASAGGTPAQVSVTSGEAPGRIGSSSNSDCSFETR